MMMIIVFIVEWLAGFRLLTKRARETDYVSP